jgi:hypothetical protein
VLDSLKDEQKMKDEQETSATKKADPPAKKAP